MRHYFCPLRPSTSELPFHPALPFALRKGYSVAKGGEGKGREGLARWAQQPSTCSEEGHKDPGLHLLI